MLNELSDQAKVWVFQADRQLSADNVQTIHKALDVFIPEWSAHGANLKSDYAIVNELFILVGVDESFAEASGCSKDSLTRAIKAVGDEVNVDFFNRLNSAYIDQDGHVALADMVKLKALLTSKTIDENTIVFNNLIETKADLNSKWKVALRESWQANLVPTI